MTTLTQLPQTGLILVRVKSDSDQVRFLASLNDPDRGVLSARLRPTTRRFGWIARSLLAALGKSRDVAGKGRNDTEDEALLPVWLAAHGITDVLLAGAETLTPSHAHTLTMLSHSLGFRLWLVAEGALTDTLLDLGELFPVHPLSASDFSQHWSVHLEDHISEDPAPTPGPHIEVPSSDFPTFYADLCHLLQPDQGAPLAARYSAEFASAAEFFTTADSAALTEDGISDHLRERFQDCPTRAEMVTTVRAFQAAGFVHYWFVQVDLDTLLSSGAEQLSALITNPETWRALRAYRQPYRAAVCVLAGAGLDLATIRTLPADAVSADFTRVTVGEKTYRVPGGGEVFLRAQALWRTLSSTSERSISTETDAEFNPRGLPRILDAVARELGLIFSPGAINRETNTAKQWRARHGVSVQPLRPTGRRKAPR